MASFVVVPDIPLLVLIVELYPISISSSPLSVSLVLPSLKLSEMDPMYRTSIHFFLYFKRHGGTQVKLYIIHQCGDFVDQAMVPTIMERYHVF